MSAIVTTRSEKGKAISRRAASSMNRFSGEIHPRVKTAHASRFPVNDWCTARQTDKLVPALEAGGRLLFRTLANYN